ncbi:MAG: ribonuclease R [Burkholderiaceae bacterium]|jgi:ribonuclease R|nr:ribonuclease R [Burkholderiaceae bacterium]
MGFALQHSFVFRKRGNHIKNLNPTGLFPEEIEGTVLGHRDGHGFVQRDDGQTDIYLPPNEMRAALHKDRVQARVVRLDRRGRPEGRIVEIIERSAQPIIGRLLHESSIWLVAPEDKRYGQDVLIPKGATGTAKAGQVVVAQLTEPPALFGQPVGRVIEVLGEIDDPGMEVEIAVRKYDVPHVFTPECLAEAKALPEKVRPQDKRARVDLTDIALLTIDGEDARDFDDAVYCERARVGRAKGWRLLVAIADVSHYVQTGSPIDIDAYARATSVYFPRRVIPMLPEKLSNGLCSLNPEVERLCMVCDMLISSAGEIHAYQFYPAVMYSHARLTYTEVAAILTNTRGPEAVRRQERVPDLLNLHDVYRALLKARSTRGAVDFETTETQIICDEAGRIESIEPRVRTEAHRLIEEAMLAANVCSADFIMQGKHPGLYRVHEGPTPEKKEVLRNYLRAMGVGLSISDEPRPAEFQAVALATKDRPDAPQIHTMLLRSMQQALYTPINSGHFGLAYEAYTHFTSPIRRYPDLLVHRVIKAILGKTRYRLPILPPPGEAQIKLARRLSSRVQAPMQKLRSPHKAAANGPAQIDGAGPAHAETLAWEAAGLHCSANERRADEASRDVLAWLKCQYMREHLGGEFSGTVSAVTTFGLFVTLDSMYVDGLVHITELGGEYFRFDEARQELRGERTGIRYTLGTRVRVQVSRVDLDGRRIDFRLIRESQERDEWDSRNKAAAPANAVPHSTAPHSAARGTPAKAVAKSTTKGAAKRAPKKAAKESADKSIKRAVKKTAKKTKTVGKTPTKAPSTRRTAHR